MGQPPPRPRPDHLRRPARPHRRDPSRLQPRTERRRAREGGSAAQRVRDRRHRNSQAPRCRHHQSQYPHRRSRTGGGRAAHSQRIEAASVSALGHGAGQRRDALEVPLHRPAPRRHAVQHRTAAQGGAGHPRQPRFAGLLRNRDSVHDALHARRRARLSRPQPRAAGNRSTPCRNRRNCSSRS